MISYDYDYTVVTPVLWNNWVFLGETAKFVSISKQRIKSIFYDDNYINLLIEGAVGENVRLTFFDPKMKKLDCICDFKETSTTHFQLNFKTNQFTCSSDK